MNVNGKDITFDRTFPSKKKWMESTFVLCHHNINRTPHSIREDGSSKSVSLPPAPSVLLVAWLTRTTQLRSPPGARGGTFFKRR